MRTGLSNLPEVKLVPFYGVPDNSLPGNSGLDIAGPVDQGAAIRRTGKREYGQLHRESHDWLPALKCLTLADADRQPA